MASKSSENESQDIIDKTDTHIYDGVKFPWTCMPATLDCLRDFEVREDDVYLVTYPKAGTTWLQELVSLICNHGNPNDVIDIPLDVRVPHLEITVPMDREGKMTAPPAYLNIKTMESPRLIKTHLPKNLLPRQLHEKRPKIIYLARNPKDLAVSFFHFYKINPFLKTYNAWETFLMDFMKGDVIYGKWSDHALSWWKNRQDENVLFLKYEDMKRDLSTAVVQISEFLGEALDTSAVRRVVDHCSFESMKKNPMATKVYLCAALGIDPHVDSPFVRKGKVGGWRDVFTVAQNEVFDEVYQRWVDGSGVNFDFEI
ncbi:sulfotransferase 1B1-like [Glandiceps talaboti]